jgi:hypothetical protein
VRDLVDVERAGLPPEVDERLQLAVALQDGVLASEVRSRKCKNGSSFRRKTVWEGRRRGGSCRFGVEPTTATSTRWAGQMLEPWDPCLPEVRAGALILHQRRRRERCRADDDPCG